jgi:hypothetical protein
LRRFSRPVSLPPHMNNHEKRHSSWCALLARCPAHLQRLAGSSTCRWPPLQSPPQTRWTQTCSLRAGWQHNGRVPSIAWQLDKAVRRGCERVWAALWGTLRCFPRALRSPVSMTSSCRPAEPSRLAMSRTSSFSSSCSTTAARGEARAAYMEGPRSTLVAARPRRNLGKLSRCKAQLLSRSAESTRITAAARLPSTAAHLGGPGRVWRQRLWVVVGLG